MRTENTNPPRPTRGWLSPIIYLSNNWLSLTGVVLVTTSAVLWFLLLPTTLRGHTDNPYIGILAFLGLPVPFFAGLILIPLGMWLKRRREGYAGIYPPEFPEPSWRNVELRRLFYFIGATTFVNLVIASQLGYGAVNYMDSVTFCGKTCHNVMQPEYTAYQASPHSRVECVKCHIGPGASWFVRSKLSGVGQVFAATFDTYPRPIPTPVRNLRPARETCEACHWPQKFGEDRLKVISTYAEDEHNTLTRTVLLMKIGGGNRGMGIHGMHLGPGITIRYKHTDEARQNIPWVEYDGPGGKRVFAVADPKGGPKTDDLPTREMDCMDCHNRPTHTYELPERGLDRAMNAGQISPSLPFAKKKGLELLKATYASRDDAARQIPAAFAAFYQQKYPDIWSQQRAQVDAAAQGVLDVWNRNIFPDMKVTWGTYPNNLGHMDFPGCFRCHDGSHATKSGDSITQDCNACHNLLASDEANPKILSDLGIPDAKR
jgi:NapC/NirT cytochrome c family, N-terminal region/Cytochrome c7 and related cytochrome c